MGGELKPSLDLVVVAPWDLDRTAGTGPPVSQPPRIDMAHPSGQVEHRSRRWPLGQGPPSATPETG
jgi:hypothetical protein